MNCLATVSRYASLVKFSHTIFALPFALVGYVYALRSNGLPFEWQLICRQIFQFYILYLRFKRKPVYYPPQHLVD